MKVVVAWQGVEVGVPPNTANGTAKLQQDHHFYNGLTHLV